MTSEDGTVYAAIHFWSAGRIVCSPRLDRLEVERGRTTPFTRSDDPRAVTCRLCRRTPEWARSMAAAPAIAGRDFNGV